MSTPAHPVLGPPGWSILRLRLPPWRVTESIESFELFPGSNASDVPMFHARVGEMRHGISKPRLSGCCDCAEVAVRAKRIPATDSVKPQNLT